MDKQQKDIYEGLLDHYEWLLNEMQKGRFYCEDENGFLRRWYPPKPMLRPEKIAPPAAHEGEAE
jgi:hypothetical protein